MAYSVQGTALYSGESFSVQRNADTATVTIVIDEGYPSEIVIKDASASVLADLQQIVTRNKMYGYKSTNKPKARIMDGDMWIFGLKYTMPMALLSVRMEIACAPKAADKLSRKLALTSDPIAKRHPLSKSVSA